MSQINTEISNNSKDSEPGTLKLPFADYLDLDK